MWRISDMWRILDFLLYIPRQKLGIYWFHLYCAAITAAATAAAMCFDLFVL